MIGIMLRGMRVMHGPQGAWHLQPMPLAATVQRQPKRHQVTDIPPVKPIVTEHQIHTLQCPDCGHRCRGQLPQQTCTQTDLAKRSVGARSQPQ